MNYVIFVPVFIGLYSIKNPLVSCKCPKILKETYNYYEHGSGHNILILSFLIIMGLLTVLIILGMIKGCFGVLCCNSVGMCGLPLLIDLPRPLDEYEESELAGREVKYDKKGWPIDPDTGERSVRVLTRKAEFCLNTVFFLTYPLAILVKFCGLCFNKKEDKGERIRKVCKRESGPGVDMYGDDDDMAEEEDTRYVINQMHNSRDNLEYCKCDDDQF